MVQHVSNLAKALLCLFLFTNLSWANDNNPNNTTVPNQYITNLNKSLSPERENNNNVLDKKISNPYFDQAVALYQAEDYQNALPLFVQATRMGNMKAPRYLGLMYLNGLGVKYNASNAFKYFVLAAQRGDITGQYWLGHLYETGTGVNQDMQQAIRWYSISAKRGDIISAPALTALGRIYEFGLGDLKRDVVTAKEYYQQAADVGYEPAIKALNTLNAHANLVVTPDLSKFQEFQDE
ncbi:hypothetical protein CKF54_05885 [Psittacicella hinzii]|uniref:Sel1 repeat family protein n=1 Tax=Psittacicella hinzii TaxID=2028575 RepID=A0A3A1Y3U4_9GAMM|nr:tetratricopeptide repeat protein [Psittacicella hinzii]RIY31969.1 hypothetical protein CKF54_05885 [Psittacicella hinzii]